MPPTRMPTQITLTLFGRNGTGPVSNIPKRKNMVPAATIFWKFFFASGTKFKTVEVKV